MIEANDFRNNLGTESDQSIWIESKMISTIMKIFAKEYKVRQYKIPEPSYLVVLCFFAHKLIIETDEDGHPYYENNPIWHESIENLGFTFIRINPDPDPDAGFDLEMLKSQKYTITLMNRL